jgi:glycerophosphoryl diester phosphodiesterase
VIGHGGYKVLYPENTLSSFRAAFAAGADGIECDIQRTSDGRYAVIHDPDIRRVAGSNLAVDAMSLSELQGFDAGRGERVPAPEDLLSEIPSDALLDLELKGETLSVKDCRRILWRIQSRIDPGCLMVSSFCPRLLFHFRRVGVITGLLIGAATADLGILRLSFILLRLRPRLLNVPIQIFHFLGRRKAWILVRLFRLLGFSLLFWTVNREQDLDEIRGLAEAIVTDDVGSMLGFLSALGHPPETSRLTYERTSIASRSGFSR